MYKFDVALSSAEFAELLGGDYHVWDGCAGYDTRPYVVPADGAVARWERLPVSYWSGDACNHIPDTGDVEAGDVEGFLEALPLDTVVVIPDRDDVSMDVEYIRTLHGWDVLDNVVVPQEFSEVPEVRYCTCPNGPEYFYEDEQGAACHYCGGVL